MMDYAHALEDPDFAKEALYCSQRYIKLCEELGADSFKIESMKGVHEKIVSINAQSNEIKTA